MVILYSFLFLSFASYFQLALSGLIQKMPNCEIFFLFFPENRIWFKHIYFRNVYIYNTYKSTTIGLERKHKSLFSSFPRIGFDISCNLSPIMKCQILFSGKNKKNSSMSSVKILPSVLSAYNVVSSDHPK